MNIELPTYAELDQLSREALLLSLRGRGLKTTGSKNALINRLISGYHQKIEDSIDKRSSKTNPLYCCVPLCHSNTHTDGVTLHRIPSGDERKQTRKAWISRLRTVRANLSLNNSTRLCSLHFPSDSFKDHSLLPDAIPTIFPSKQPKTPTAERKNPLANKRRVDNDLEERVKHQRVAYESVDSIHDIASLAPESRAPDESVDIGTQTHDPFTYAQCRTCGSQRQETRDFSCQTTLPDIDVADLKGDNKKTRFFTGFYNFGTLMLMYTTLMKHSQNRLNYWDGESSLVEKKYHSETPKSKPGPSRQLSTLSEFLMTMMWYRMGLLEEHLAFIFKVSTSTVSRILTTWTQFIYEHSVGLVHFPSREQVLLNLPPHFINHSNVFIVLDCTEFWMEKPSGLEAQNVTWSEYKHHNTIKSLIGCTPDGLTTFISDSYGGRASDRFIVQQEDLLKSIPEGMAVMADKGFEIHDLAPEGVEIIIPPKVSSEDQMSDSEFYRTLCIAESRIVVEMKMEQAKNYKILQVQFPISRICTAHQIIFNCFALTNLLPPLLAPGTNPEDKINIPMYCQI